MRKVLTKRENFPNCSNPAQGVLGRRIRDRFCPGMARLWGKCHCPEHAMHPPAGWRCWAGVVGSSLLPHPSTLASVGQLGRVCSLGPLKPCTPEVGTSLISLEMG